MEPRESEGSRQLVSGTAKRKHGETRETHVPWKRVGPAAAGPGGAYAHKHGVQTPWKSSVRGPAPSQEHHEGATVSVSGTIDRLIYPKSEEDYDGFGVALLVDGKKLVGNLPVVDKYHTLHAVCRCEKSVRKGGRPGAHDISMLVGELGMREQEADARVASMVAHLGLRSRCDVLDASALEGFEWARRLLDEVPYFRFDALKTLRWFWPQRQLSRLSMQQTYDVCAALRERPAEFFFQWMGEYGDRLEELGPAHVPLWKKAFGDGLDADFVDAVRLCARARKEFGSRRHLHFPRSGAFWGSVSPATVRFMLKHKIVKIATEAVGPGDRVQSNVYVAGDYEVMTRFAASLVGVFDADAQTLPDAGRVEEVLSGGGASPLSPEQRRAFSEIVRSRFCLLLGPAGTGKTTVGKRVFGVWEPGVALPVASYGRVAARLREAYGKGQTIMKAACMIAAQRAKDPSVPHKLEETRVLIVDEVSTSTMQPLAELMKLLPRLERVVLLGDEHQMNAIGNGGFLGALLRRYDGTPLVQRLTRVFRVSEADGILKSNFEKIRNGDPSIDYSTDVGSGHPFVVVPRTASVESDVRAVVSSAAAAGEVAQLMTERNRDLGELNKYAFAAMAGARGGGAPEGRKYEHSVFYPGDKVLFKENHYGEGAKEDPLRSDPVMNGETAVISTVEDVGPDGKHAVQRSSTAEPRHGSQYCRVVKFTSGVQVNTRVYPVSLLARGYCCTIASMQGGEVSVSQTYIPKDFSQFFTRDVLYTAVSRARDRVIVVCGFSDPTDITTSDLAKIVRRDPERGACNLHLYLPRYDDALRGKLTDRAAAEMVDASRD